MTDGQFEQLARWAVIRGKALGVDRLPVSIDDHLPSPRMDEERRGPPGDAIHSCRVRISRADYADYCRRVERRLAVTA